jgi:hypothetical protein
MAACSDAGLKLRVTITYVMDVAISPAIHAMSTLFRSFANGPS